MKRFILLVIGLGALVVNPFFGCDPGPPEFHYGEREMRAAIEGTWKVSIGPEGTIPAHNLTITIVEGKRTPSGALGRSSPRRPLVREAAACEDRSLVRSAGACVDITTMAVDVKAVAGASGEGTGVLMVDGTVFTTAHLSCSFGGVYFSATVSPRGEISELSSGMATGTMVRIAAR